MNDEIIVQKVLKNINVNPKTFFLRSSSSSIKDSLRKKLVMHMKKVFLVHLLSYQIIKFFGVKIELNLLLKEASK